MCPSQPMRTKASVGVYIVDPYSTGREGIPTLATNTGYSCPIHSEKIYILP